MGFLDKLLRREDRKEEEEVVVKAPRPRPRRKEVVRSDQQVKRASRQKKTD